MNCSICGVELEKTEGAVSVWISKSSRRATCPRGGPHRPRVVDVEVDWDQFDNVLDSWANDAI